MDTVGPKKVLLGLTVGELSSLCQSLGMPSYAGGQIASWLYDRGATTIGEMTNLSKASRELLAERCEVGRRAPIAVEASSDGTRKYLFPTSAGGCVETVFIPEGDRGTLCVSCQVGCKMHCVFCQTGRQGFSGHLTAGDILNQVYSLPERERLTNIVFMGQGEPTDNLDNVLRAVSLLQANYGMAWSSKRITISTVGLRGKLEALLQRTTCHIAVSLHSAEPAVRELLVPAEKAYPVREMVSLLRRYDFSHQRRLTFEYTMFSGVNDTIRSAQVLVYLLRGMTCRVNLIRYHAVDGVPYRCSSPAAMQRMCDYLCAHSLPTTIRVSRGEDIAAACGQLTTLDKGNKER